MYLITVATETGILRGQEPATLRHQRALHSVPTVCQESSKRLLGVTHSSERPRLNLSSRSLFVMDQTFRTPEPASAQEGEGGLATSEPPILHTLGSFFFFPKDVKDNSAVNLVGFFFPLMENEPIQTETVPLRNGAAPREVGEALLEVSQHSEPRI